MPGVLTAQAFAAHTPRELEDMIAGAIVHHEIQRDLFLEHALRVGQWTRPVTFQDLARRDPMVLDPRDRAPATPPDPLVEDRETRARLMVAEAQARALRPNTVTPG